MKGLNFLPASIVLCIFFLISEVHKYGGENNNNVEGISSVRKEWLIPVKKEDIKNNDRMNSDACEEYHVALEKMWGSLGLKIEVCISQRSIILGSIIIQ
jgi:hypothetical protein